MRKQSASYSPFTDVRESGFRLDFEIVDSAARDNAVFSSSPVGAGDLLHFQDEIDNASGQVSLEHNMWLLNGTRRLMSPKEDVGWWSQSLSNDEAQYSEPTYIYAYFGGHPVSTIGLSINFDSEAEIYPTKVRITTYASDEETALYSEEFQNDSAIAVFAFKCDNYYAIKIEFLESRLPGYRVRVGEVLFGIVKRYNNDTIESLKLVHSASVAAESLPSAQLEVSVDNSQREYDLLSPKNIFAYLQEGEQPLRMRAVINGEIVEMGSTYYTSAKVSGDGMTATITANDKVLQLDRMTFTGRSGTATLTNMVTEVLDGFALEVEYEGDLGSVIVNRSIPANTTKREALRLLAQAACCTCWINREGTLYFGRLDVAEVPAQIITDDELYNFNGISISANIGTVQLNVDDSFAGINQSYYAGTGGSIKVISNPCAYNGQTVVDWLYASYQRRRQYAVQNQGDPALEIGDTVKIYDAYNQNLNAAMTGLQLNYDGGLSIITSAVGEG